MGKDEGELISPVISSGSDSGPPGNIEQHLETFSVVTMVGSGGGGDHGCYRHLVSGSQGCC